MMYFYDIIHEITMLVNQFYVNIIYFLITRAHMYMSESIHPWSFSHSCSSEYLLSFPIQRSTIK